tara:strand:- start:1165 stop:1350 length:186 start_codon:yes stop_codon:yes gene_type:complete
MKKQPKSFKPHMMYDKSGKGYKANTFADHLNMKRQGYSHQKPKSSDSAKRAKRLLSKKQKM